MQFFHVKSAAEARALFARPAPILSTETLPLDDALGRVLCGPVRSPIDLPEFPRAVVDGYAVRAADTFGASAALPAYVRLAGEIGMGRPALQTLGAGDAFRIATGGMLPEGADAVVMVEQTEVAGADLVEIFRPVAPGEGWVQAGDDLRAGQRLLEAGRRLRAADLGLLAGVGVTAVEVFRRPVAAVIPTGDEIVDPEARPRPGQVRDINTTALSAGLRSAGVCPRPYPIVRDDPEALRAVVAEALDAADLLLMAGGSSVGTRDWTLETLLSFPGAELLLHGVSIRPGKPVILVALGEKLLIGLPGNPLSALVVFEQFVRPYLRRLSGERRRLPDGGRVSARLTRSYSSDPGKEDYLRVRLLEEGDGWRAEPLLGKSTLLMTLVEADGLVTVPEQVEGLEAGEWVDVELL